LNPEELAHLAPPPCQRSPHQPCRAQQQKSSNLWAGRQRYDLGSIFFVISAIRFFKGAIS
jgi:hypothetical protein